jgi:hypothetical protein
LALRSMAATSGSGGGNAAANARYAYLVGRLRTRQITMEEATELFTMMQAMLAQSEAARLALSRTIPPPPPSAGRTSPPSPGPVLATAGSDDFLLMGILAMGAGAGLLAALTKRIQDLPPSPAPASRGGGTGPSKAAP